MDDLTLEASEALSFGFLDMVMELGGEKQVMRSRKVVQSVHPTAAHSADQAL